MDLSAIQCNYLPILCVIPFLACTIYVSVRSFCKNKQRREGYRIVGDVEGESFEKSNSTITEYLICFMTLVQLLVSLSTLLIPNIQYFELIFNIALFIGWLIQFIIIFRSLDSSTISQNHYLTYLAHIGSQVYSYQLHRSTDRLHVVMQYSKLIGSIVLLFLDIVNPPQNASVLESIITNDRIASKEVTASIWSKITFSWVDPLLRKGYEKSIEAEDLPNLSEDDQMHNIVEAWKKKRIMGRNIIWEVLRFTKWFALYQICVSIITTILDFSKPFFINLLLVWIQNKKEDESVVTGIYILLGQFGCALLRQILYSQINLSSRHWGIQLRSIFIYEIFKKSLRRTGGHSLVDDDKNQKASQGKIVSLMSDDTNQIRSFLTDIHSMLIDLPLSIVLSISGLIYVMGTPALGGLVVIIISAPISSWAMTRLYKILKVTRKFVDRRIQVTNEALQGIRIIKYMAWESRFVEKICEARENELQSRLKLLLNNLVVQFVSWGSSILVTFVSFVCYTVLLINQIIAGKNLDAATAFTSISLLSTVSFTLNSVSEMVSDLLNISVTISRLNGFLTETELEKFADKSPDITSNTQPFEREDSWIGIRDAEVGYHTSSPTREDAPSLAYSFRLQNINIKFPKNKLSIIIGATGSGKSSLLLTLLGEMKIYSGMYSIPENHLLLDSTQEKSDIAYVSQTPWLMNATIRQNILFGEEFEKDRYLMAIKACALLKDLDTLEYGDATEIGEKGVNLSGGQKARVALARAVYSSAPIVLLDDPLSAVDAPTARHLLKHCILDALQNRTIILVTHAIQLMILKCDHVVFMKNGSVISQGSPTIVIQDPLVTLIEDRSTEENSDHSTDIPGEEPILKSVKQPYNREGKATGSVKWETYKTYVIASGGILFIFGINFSYVLQIGSDFLSNWWIAVWSNSLRHLSPKISLGAYYFADEMIHISTNPDNLYYISVYGIICSLELFGSIFKFCIQFFGGLQASRMMHQQLVESVLGSPLRFFEKTPLGRIINRFSKDLSDIDRTVMFTLVRFYTVILGSVARILIISCVSPPFALSLFLLYFYCKIAKYYLKTSREIKRVESISNSPIYGQFGETLCGASVIRAYGAELQSSRQIQRKVDDNHRAYFYLFATNQWLIFRTSLLSCFIVLAAGSSVLYTGLSAGWAGIAFNFSNDITRMISRSIQSHSSLEMAMNAVERVNEYSKLEQEAIKGDKDLPKIWPTAGHVVIKDLSIRYAPGLPLVLKAVSFNIQAGEKIGIVGRTGAGKSTLSLAFFRILDAIEGSIIIDGIDISRIGIRELRSRLTIIPQDPILFEGTLRSNLDPLDEHSDAKIWQALKQTQVLESLRSAESGLSLDTLINENGSNYSQGQRQLICLARAWLRQSKFIFLDEATASVDPETDAKIQCAIRQEFSCGTVVTVAHRLKTIADYDRIIVLDYGRVAEIGTPWDLMNAKGHFHKMCIESGDYSELCRIAKDGNLTRL